MNVLEFIRSKTEGLQGSVTQFRAKLEPQFQHWSNTLNNKISNTLNNPWMTTHNPFEGNVFFSSKKVIQNTEAEKAYKELKKQIGQEIFVGEWVTVDQNCINQFAEVTGDKQWIHTDPVRANKESPFKTTIAHGFLTLALIPKLTNAINSGKVIIFNLSKGTLGKDTSNAYGRFVVAMAQYYAFKRVLIPEDDRPHTYLCIDEFHNYTCNDMKEILEETRKYKMFMVLANQYIKQIPMDVQNSILENTVVKVVGRSDEEESRSLKAGEFFINSGSVNHGKPAKVYVPNFLVKNKNSMKKTEWEEVKEKQIEKYYKKIVQNEDIKTDEDLKCEAKQNKHNRIGGAENKSHLKGFEPNLETDINID